MDQESAMAVTLLRELRSAATLWPGFISGRSVVDAFNPTIFMGEEPQADRNRR